MTDYAAGHSLADPYGASSTRGTRDYEPLGDRARWTVRLLLLAALVDVVAIGAGGAEHSMLSRGLAALTVDDLHAIDARNQAIGIAQVVVLALAAIAFLRWLHRAHRNVVELGATDLRCGPGWAVGIWFVPIANLWRPKQVIDDVWRASDPELAEDVGDGWKNERPSRLTGLWWAALILSGLVARVASGMSVRTLADLQSRTSAFMFSDLLSVVAAIAAIAIVRRVTTRQEHRADLR